MNEGDMRPRRSAERPDFMGAAAHDPNSEHLYKVNPARSAIVFMGLLILGSALNVALEWFSWPLLLGVWTGYVVIGAVVTVLIVDPLWTLYFQGQNRLDQDALTNMYFFWPATLLITVSYVSLVLLMRLAFSKH